MGRGYKNPRCRLKPAPTYMDLRVYYQKIRKIEAEIKEPFIVVVSRETPDGGKAGLKSEVPRPLAAKLIAEETAAPATDEEASDYRAEQEQQRIASIETEANGVADARLSRPAMRPVKKP